MSHVDLGLFSEGGLRSHVDLGTIGLTGPRSQDDMGQNPRWYSLYSTGVLSPRRVRGRSSKRGGLSTFRVPGPDGLFSACHASL